MQSYGICKVSHQRLPQLHCTQDEKWQKSFFPWAIFLESSSICWKNWGLFISFVCIPEVVKTIPMHLVIDVALQTDFSLHPPPPYSSISTTDGWRSVCIAHSLVALVLCWIAPLPHLVKCRCLWQRVDSIQFCAWHQSDVYTNLWKAVESEVKVWPEQICWSLWLRVEEGCIPTMEDLGQKGKN